MFVFFFTFMLDCLIVSLFTTIQLLWRSLGGELPRNDSSATCWLVLHGQDRALDV
jgi:hypothetical protein